MDWYSRSPAGLPGGWPRRRPATLGENRELMDKNRIAPSGARQPARKGCPQGGCGGTRQRRHGAMSWHNTAKSSGVPVEVNAAAVRWSNVQLPGEICQGRPWQKSAEAIVVEETSRSADEHSKIAGATHPMKGRTNEEGIDPATDKPTLSLIHI